MLVYIIFKKHYPKQTIERINKGMLILGLIFKLYKFLNILIENFLFFSLQKVVRGAPIHILHAYIHTILIYSIMKIKLFKQFTISVWMNVDVIFFLCFCEISFRTKMREEITLSPRKKIPILWVVMFNSLDSGI